MTWIGPFWMMRPNAATTIEDYAWCYFWYNKAGRVCMIEWQ